MARSSPSVPMPGRWSGTGAQPTTTHCTSGTGTVRSACPLVHSLSEVAHCALNSSHPLQVGELPKDFPDQAPPKASEVRGRTGSRSMTLTVRERHDARKKKEFASHNRSSYPGLSQNSAQSQKGPAGHRSPQSSFANRRSAIYREANQAETTHLCAPN